MFIANSEPRANGTNEDRFTWAGEITIWLGLGDLVSGREDIRLNHGEQIAKQFSWPILAIPWRGVLIRRKLRGDL